VGPHLTTIISGSLKGPLLVFGAAVTHCLVPLWEVQGGLQLFLKIYQHKWRLGSPYLCARLPLLTLNTNMRTAQLNYFTLDTAFPWVPSNTLISVKTKKRQAKKTDIKAEASFFMKAKMSLAVLHQPLTVLLHLINWRKSLQTGNNHILNF